MTARRLCYTAQARAQRGMALLVSLVMLLILTLIGISSMQDATLQEKMGSSVMSRNQTFQVAEAALRIGENAVAATTFNMAVCTSVATCAPLPDSSTVIAAGLSSNGTTTWVAVPTTTSLYGIQRIGATTAAVNTPTGCTSSSLTLYRVTSVALFGSGYRTVLESIYGKC